MKTPTQNLLRFLLLLMLGWSLILVEIRKLGLVKILKFKFKVKMLMFGWDFEVDAWLRFWRWNLIKICVVTYRSYFGKQNLTLESVLPLAMFRLITSSSFIDKSPSSCRCHSHYQQQNDLIHDLLLTTLQHIYLQYKWANVFSVTHLLLCSIYLLNINCCKKCRGS